MLYVAVINQVIVFFSASATVSGSATTTSMPSLGNGFLMDELSASYQEHHERK